MIKTKKKTNKKYKKSNKGKHHHAAKFVLTKKRKITYKIKKRCKVNILLLLNLMLNCTNLKIHPVGTMPKIDNCNLYKNITENIYNERSVTATNTITLLAEWRAAKWLDRLADNPEFVPAHKVRNKLVKIRNGNGVKTLKIVHWNMWSRHFINKKEEVDNVISEFRPDLFLISEAYHYPDNPEYQSHVNGYTLQNSPTFMKHKYDRLLLLIRDGLNIRIRTDLIDDDDLASIWIDIIRRGARKTTFGFVYREHKLLLQEEGHVTGSCQQQERRWTSFIRQWVKACQGADVIILGDTNLDHLRWDQPEFHQVNMVNQVKTQLETKGFIQHVTGFTRCWRGQTSSLLDHCWSNCATRIASCRNLVRGASDHNLVEVVVRMKGLNKSPTEIIKRMRNNFNADLFKSKASEIDWTEVLMENNVNVSYSHFEEKIRQLLDEMSPMRKIQVTTRHKSWLSWETRALILQRDLKREEARSSDIEQTWTEYRLLRNRCTSAVKKDRCKQYNDIYQDIETRQDSRDLYKQAKAQLGWNAGKSPQAFILEGISVTSPLKIANAQLEYFAKKIRDLVHNLPPPHWRSQ